ncbi:MAG: circularly permuted type 2 ATP-grasp protein [Verrucomicrobiae bacterium]|nr:circularly permuted type 2 ATP-grasp protein [Verrucomicrobiae bacterium]
MIEASGAIRPHYRAMLRELQRLGPAELRRRSDTGRRIIHEQGVTYNVYGDPRGMERPWELDPIPLLIAPEEWHRLERALIQRATLIDRILADCYGPQDLIRSGWLPPALVFGQPDFLRPAHAARPIEDTYLHFYAADLARSPDGQWWVVSDRTQIPTGTGYTLANRLVTSRILPEAFREAPVQRLAAFFREVQSALSRLGTRRTDDPRVVLLTPGPYNETYFEQAYLARYLGYALVEGQDLTVRDDRVFLKTLSGLEPVDVLLRRVDDEFCDPLELRNDSILGVPGLLEALRAGNVTVANALGSGLLQSPAFMAFLPGLCRHLLSEELRMPSVATWWCGQKAGETYVLDHLEELFIKPAFRSHLKGTQPDQPMTAEAWEALRERIRFQPHLWVAQERVKLSRAPSWTGSVVAPRPVGLRVYVVATAAGYRVMPGGLARLAPEPGGRFISMQRGGASKDTWVLSDAPVEEVSLLHREGGGVELRRVGNNLPSRMADNFFWLGRYSERADATGRLLRSTLLRFNPESTGSALPLITPLLDTLERQGQLPQAAAEPARRQNSEALEAELLAAIFNPQQPGSLRAIADQLERLGMLVRDRTSNDLWRVVSQLNDKLALPASSPPMLAGDAIALLSQTLLHLASFYGIARENMTRAQAWRFLDMGQRIERAAFLGTFLDAALQSPEADNPSVLEAVLEVADSTLTYRSRYNLLPEMAAVYDLVLLDDTNPRSLLFQLIQLEQHFARLPRERETALPSPAHRILIGMASAVRLLDPRDLKPDAGAWDDTDTGRTLRRIRGELPELSDALSASYFAHAPISRAGPA